MTYDELLQFCELQRRVVALEQKATNDNNMVLKKAPNFANRLVEAFERIEKLVAERDAMQGCVDVLSSFEHVHGAYQEFISNRTTVLAKLDSQR